MLICSEISGKVKNIEYKKFWQTWNVTTFYESQFERETIDYIFFQDVIDVNGLYYASIDFNHVGAKI